jgi:16S rRNA (adenine1518-N6/adenine1519-N6)-dimethyltransferase
MNKQYSQGLRAKKSLGQNFCINEAIPEEIIARLAITPNHEVWEIGPGKGALTSHISKLTDRLRLFEIDQRLQEILPQKFPEAEIIWGDFLEIEPEQIAPPQKPLLVCGNLPYYCGTPIIRRFLEQGPHAEKLVFLLQQEVALKAAAGANQKDYGFLSVQVQLFAKAQSGSTFLPASFSPPPKINSTILEISPIVLSETEKQRRIRALKTISLIFNQRRKMALSLLKKRLPEQNWEERFTRLAISKTARPENIEPHVLLELFEPQV